MNRIRPLALGAILLAVAGCTSAAVAPTAVAPTALPSPQVTVGPASPEPSPSRTAEPTPPPPVPATLDHADGTPVVGEVGSYTIDGFGSDGPWLPASSLVQTVTVNVGDRLRIRLDGSPALGQWSVAAARADDTRATGLIGLGDGDAAPRDGVVVPAPPPGDWVVMASLSFEGGSGAYYWHVIVTE